MEPLTLETLIQKSRMSKIFLVSLLLITGLVVLGLELAEPYLYLAPDSFTYFQMAKVFHETGLFFSYSGIDYTTGIHPLFYFLLLPLYPFFGLFIPSASFFINGLILLLGLYVLYRSVGTIPALVVGFFVLTSYGATLTNNGMESALAVFALSLLIAFLSKWHERETPLQLKGALTLGSILGILLFARLDLIFVVLSFYFVSIAFYIRRNSWNTFALKDFAQDMLWISAPLIVLLLCIFSINLLYGGSLLPISGAIKSSFPYLTPEWAENLYRLKIFPAALIVLSGYIWIQRQRQKELGVTIPTLLLASFFLYFYNALFASGLGSWYGVLPFFSTALVVGLLFRDSKVPSEKITSVKWIIPIVTGAVAVLVLSSHITLEREDWITAHQQAAHYLDSHSKPGETAGELKDGVFAFYSSIPVFSLTGLANNKEYVDSILGGTLPEYLTKKSIRYIVTGDFHSGVQIKGHESLFTNCIDPIYDTRLVKIYKTENCSQKRP